MSTALYGLGLGNRNHHRFYACAWRSLIAPVAAQSAVRQRQYRRCPSATREILRVAIWLERHTEVAAAPNIALMLITHPRASHRPTGAAAGTLMNRSAPLRQPGSSDLANVTIMSAVTTPRDSAANVDRG